MKYNLLALLFGMFVYTTDDFPAAYIQAISPERSIACDNESDGALIAQVIGDNGLRLLSVQGSAFDGNPYLVIKGKYWRLASYIRRQECFTGNKKSDLNNARLRAEYITPFKG